MIPERWCAIDSPRSGAPAALGVIAIHGPPHDIDAAFARFRWPPVRIGALVVRRIEAGAELLVARPTPTHAILTPLGSRREMDRLIALLHDAGFPMADEADPRGRYPEASDLVEACALDAIAKAASPRAIDAILAQRATWNRHPLPPIDETAAPSLDRLINPPRIAVVGRPNVGKSTLMNAMAGRSVAIAADEPGTTRDHLGADIDCDGLRIHWIDTPGIPAPGDAPSSDLDRIAIDRARDAIRIADLIVLTVDPIAGEVGPHELPHGPPAVRIGIRADLGAAPTPVEPRTSARTRAGLDALARFLRETLVPDAALATTGRWRFHPALPAG